MPELILHGCTPEPLMGYLKALGVLRLVSEQKDPQAKGCWRNGEFVLRSSLDEGQLLDFFKEEYRPTPVVVPWSGGDFFGVNPKGNIGPYKKTPTSSAIIEAFLASATPRLTQYRIALQSTLSSMDVLGLDDKNKLNDKTLKSAFLARLRSCLADDGLGWIDACAVIDDAKPMFNSLLGSGGGSDGNTHFSDNFMQNLWEVLPDFDDQRTRSADSRNFCSNLLKSTLLGVGTTDLVPKRTSALFDAGAVGGQNAGHGFERPSLGNPWSFILCLEGTLLLAGSLSKRQSSQARSTASFPFQFRISATGLDSSVNKETAGRELWLPTWHKPALASELACLLGEGRGTLRKSPVVNSVDFARAVVSLGIDRGIKSFTRYAILRGRVGGENYNTSALMGRFEVLHRPEIGLLLEIDQWLDRFRRAASEDKAPPRFRSILRDIERSIFSFCQNGTAQRYSAILTALGRAENALAHGERFRKGKQLAPLHGLSTAWLSAAYDGTVEFDLALALSGIYDHKVGALRENIEPVSGWRWRDNDGGVVWSSADLATNLAAVLERRLLDASRLGCERLPLAYRRPASLSAIAAFIAGQTDDERISELLLGLMLIDQSQELPRMPHLEVDAPPLPRSFALLKSLFLPHAVETTNGSIFIKPEARILSVLRAGRLDEACAIAARRLRASGLSPMPHSRRGTRDEEWNGAADGADPRRLAAALLFPVSRNDIDVLVRMIARPMSQKAAS